MPVQPNLLERLLFYQLNQAPAPLLDLAGALSYQTLATAAQLDLFRVLGRGPMTPAELASQLGAQERGIQALLAALKATGYVHEKDGRYTNTAMVEKWLNAGDFFDMASAAKYWSAVINELWPEAPEIIRGRPRSFNFYKWLESQPGISDAFQRMMVTSAKLTGETIANKLDLPATARRLLDVAGGHGIFSVIFCQHYPAIQATILDSPVALETARELIGQHDLAGRIQLLDGDLWQTDWGQDYDCVLLFNIIHHFDLETNVKLLRLASRALKPGGRLAILEQVEGKVFGGASNAFIQLIALQYYLFVDGRVYSVEEIGDMLVRAGFSSPRFHTLVKAPGTSLAVAVKE